MAGPRTHYEVHELAEGVSAAIHRPNGFGVCNSGIVDLGDGGLVFDTGLTVSSARELHAIAQTSLGRAPSLVANSHWHLDHSLGNQEFPRLPIWGTRRNREVVLEMRGDLERELRREELEKSLADLEARRPGMPPGPPTVDLELIVLIHRALLSCVGEQELRPPTETFENRVDLPGDRKARLQCFGSGHTAADAVLFLPHERLLFAGDLVCRGIEPSMGSGDPAHWLVVLDELERLGIERLVPGHGPVSGPEGIQETRDYVSGVLDAARSARTASLPAPLRPWEGSVSLEENLKFARQWVAVHEPSGSR